jgi:outer membrane protein assembly factor BamB
MRPSCVGSITSRRNLVRAGAGAALCGAVGYLIGGRAGSDDGSELGTDRSPRPLSVSGQWRQYRADAANTLAKPDTTVLPEAGSVHWRLPAASAPVFDGERLYLERANGDAGVAIAAHSSETGDSIWEGPGRTGTNRSLAIGRSVFGASGELTGLGPRDGTVRWQVGTDAHVGWAPVVDDGRLYVTGRRFDGTPAMVLAMDGETGETVWTEAFRETEADIESGLAVGDAHVFAATTDGRVVALAKSDGERRWVSDAVESVRVPVTVGDGSVFVADESGAVSALSAADGIVRWRRPVATPSGGFAYGERTLYYAATDGVYALDAGDGTRRWVNDQSEPLAPAVGADAVYVATGFDDHSLHAVDRATGDWLWSHTFSRIVEDDVIRGGARFPPVALDGGLFVTADDGLYAFGPAG